MGRHAEWELVNSKDGIIMIRDLERSGCLTITNDAEYVFSKINEIRRLVLVNGIRDILYHLNPGTVKRGII
jgi:hypothetical protein